MILQSHAPLTSRALRLVPLAITLVLSLPACAGSAPSEGTAETAPSSAGPALQKASGSGADGPPLPARPSADGELPRSYVGWTLATRPPT